MVNCFRRTEVKPVSGPWTSYQIRIIAGCVFAGTFSPPSASKESASYMYRSRHAQRHVPWCMSGSLTRGGGKDVPSIPGACANRIWQVAHWGPGLQAHTCVTESRLVNIIGKRGYTVYLILNGEDLFNQCKSRSSQYQWNQCQVHGFL